MKTLGEEQLSPVQVRNLFGGNIPTAQVLQGVASGLAGVGIRVEISPAITVPCADTKNKVIYLPSMIKSKKALLVVKMLINHEGGHIIHTPEDMVEMIDSVVNSGDINDYCVDKLEMEGVPAPLWNYAKSFWNCVEDPRIEKLMIREFPGCKHHFTAGTIAAGCDTLVTDVIEKHLEAVEEAEEQGLPEEAYPKLNPFWLAEWHAFHRVGGSHDQESRDHVKEATPEGYGWVFEIVEKHLSHVEEDITKTESIEIVRIADKTIAEIMEYLKLEKPPEDQGGGGQGKQESEEQGGKPGQGNTGPSPETNDESNPSNGKMGDESEPGKGSSGEGGDEEAGESGKRSSGDNESDSGDNSGKGGGAGDGSGEGSGGSDSDSDDADGEGDQEGVSDESSGGSGESSDGDNGEDDDSDETAGSSDGGIEDGESTGNEEGNEEKDADADVNESDGKGNPKWDQAIEWLKEAQVDMAEEIKKGLEAAEAGTEETTDANDPGGGGESNGQQLTGSPPKYVGEEDLEGMPNEYLEKIRPGMRVIVIGSQDIGKIVDGQHKASFDSYNQGIRELMPKNLGAASKKLMGEFRASFGPADKGSRLNPRMFTAIHTNKWQGKKVMLARNRTRLSKRGVCVQLVIDCSGSMVDSILGLKMGHYNSKFAVAHASARGLSRLLQSIGISFEVVGFSTAYSTSRGVAPGATESTSTSSFNPYGNESRSVDIINYVFKEFQAPWAVSEKTMLAINPSTNFYLPDGTNISPHTNSDGESILWAATRILGRKEEKKIMIVLSDGLPYAGNMRLQNAFLKWAVRRIANSGIHIGGLGLGSNGVSAYYTNCEIIDEFPPGKGELYSAPLYIQNKIISLINKMSHE